MRDACEGLVALVTGASRGIGSAIARRLAAEGAAVGVTARSLDSHPHLPGTLAETVAAIEADGGTAVAIQADLTHPPDRARIVETCEAALGPIDILVNNAAAAFYMPFEKLSERRFQVAFEVNVRAPFDLSQRVAVGMRSRGRGWIVNISSATARLPDGPPFQPWETDGGDLVYGTTKAALDRMSAGLAAELWRDGVAVNSLAPVAAVITPGVEALGIDTSEVEVEPVEALAEATLALCTGDPRERTGRVVTSRALLEELSRPVRTLDGRALLDPA